MRSGAQPDRQSLPFGLIQGTDPHDKLVADGPVKRLEGEIQHFNYWNFAEQVDRINNFSDVVLAGQLKKGKRFSLFMAVIHPPFKFLECYFKKRGFLDGWPGFVIAGASAFYILTKYVKLWEATRQKVRRPPLASEKDDR